MLPSLQLRRRRIHSTKKEVHAVCSVQCIVHVESSPLVCTDIYLTGLSLATHRPTRDYSGSLPYPLSTASFIPARTSSTVSASPTVEMDVEEILPTLRVADNSGVDVEAEAGSADQNAWSILSPRPVRFARLHIPTVGSVMNFHVTYGQLACAGKGS